jgi:hypothetical protein
LGSHHQRRRGSSGDDCHHAFIDQQERHEAIQNSVDTQNRWVGSNIDDALGFDWFVRDIETITLRCGPLHRSKRVAFRCFNFS